ncbi:MAG: L-aspartate semialdehyde sulfurtransferase ferredoxin [Candidatus Diapherotrites archaeon]|nr:L-aspartate semialdehyde sulfurtransferase ferredoxin [Candidatus Diapherotrites archaeon]MDN5366854.1 L-aspartate semialdehyde sulfurtransferase ferredoxin [Candidatus Diapherotrites archaeon]
MPEKTVAVWIGERCIQCGLCVGVCPVAAIRLTERGIEIDVEKCTGCGICVKGCPVGALQLKKIVLEAKRDA